MSLDEFLETARKLGYEGVEIRYPQLPMESSKEKLGEVSRKLKDLGLRWVFGTVEGIWDEEIFQRSLRTLDNNLSCGCLFTRFSVHKPEHIPWAQRFADEAAKRDAKLIMQLHAHTLSDNVPHTLDTFEKVNRPNVGLAFEANHLMFDGDTNYANAVHKLAKHIFTVSVQNYKPAPPDAKNEEKFTISGKPWVRALPGDPDAVEFSPVFKALKEIGFDGWVTVMCDAYPGMDSRELAKRWHDYLQPMTS